MHGWLTATVTLAWSLSALADAPRADAPLPAPPESQRLEVMVADLTPLGEVDAGLATALSSIVASRLDELGVFQVIAEEDVRKLIDFDALKNALTSCADEGEACLTEFSGLFGVPYLVAGTVAIVDGGTVVTLSLIDLATTRVAARQAMTPAPSAALVAELRHLVDKLTTTLRSTRSGTLLVGASEEGASVSIDGRIVGTTPLGRLHLPAGPARIEVTKDGFVTTRRDVIVPPQGQVEATVVLVPSPEYVARHNRIAWALRIGAITLGSAGLLFLGGGGGLWGANFFLTQSIAAETGQDSVLTPLKVRPDQFWQIMSFRVLGYVLLALSVPLVAGGVGLYFVGEEPGRYDHLLEASE